MTAFFPPYFHWWQLPLVFLAGVVGEGYGVVVGSGGVVSFFAFSAFGVPLPSIIAIDVAGAIGTDIGVIAASQEQFWRNRKIIMRLVPPIFIGGTAGTLFLVHIPVSLLRTVVIGALVLILAHTLINLAKPRTTLPQRRISKRRYSVVFVILAVLSVYTTAVSIGEGTFAKLTLVGILGMSFADSMVVRSAAVLPVRIFSLIITAISGLIIWPYLICLWAGSFVAGALVVGRIRKVPDRYLRFLLIGVTVIYLAYLLTR